MEYKEYTIKRGDTLESIAGELGTPPDELRHFHNQHCELYNLLGAGKIPKSIQTILIPLEIKKQETPLDREKEKINNLIFDQKARYRCEQVNTSSMNGILIHFAEQKHQFLLKQSLEKDLKGFVNMEEIIYNFSPPTLNQSFNILSKTELIRHNVYFSISPEKGNIEKILNKQQIYENWKTFRDNDFWKDKFVDKLNKLSPDGAKELLQMGDKQFSPSYELAEEEYKRHLFYFICFDKLLVQSVENIEKEEFLYMSTIVPPIVIPIEFRYDKISEEEDKVKIRKVGTLKLTPKLIKDIENGYNQIHKSAVKYGFTEYKLEFRVRLEFNTKEKLIETANLYIMESIADNIENICEYKLKRLHNFTP